MLTTGHLRRKKPTAPGMFSENPDKTGFGLLTTRNLPLLSCSEERGSDYAE